AVQAVVVDVVAALGGTGVDRGRVVVAVVFVRGVAVGAFAGGERASGRPEPVPVRVGVPDGRFGIDAAVAVVVDPIAWVFYTRMDLVGRVVAVIAVLDRARGHLATRPVRRGRPVAVAVGVLAVRDGPG